MAPDELTRLARLEERVNEVVDKLDSQCERVKAQLYDVKAEGDRRHGERRANCGTDCPAHLSTVQAVSKLDGSVRSMRWAYSAIGGTLLVISLAFVSWVSIQIKEFQNDSDTHNVEQAKQIVELKTKVDMMMNDHIEIKGRLRENNAR